MLFALLYLGVMLFAPLLFGLVQAILRPGIFGWQMVAANRDFWNTVAFTLGVALAATAGSAVLAGLTSFWLWLRLPGSRVILYGLAAVLLLPEFTAAASWYLVLARRSLSWLGGVLQANPAALLALVDAWRGWPVLSLILLAGLSQLSAAEIETVRLLGARGPVLWGFLFSALRPFWRVGLLVRFLQGIQLYAAGLLLFPGSRPPLLLEQILEHAGAYRRVPAVAWISMLVVLLLGVACLVLLIPPLRAAGRQGRDVTIAVLPVERSGSGV
ncbi:MAG: hypothetical protein IMX00_04765 [Limnochordales bacterium]|nr:hypothetical protein [Limnochordales bacterium]